MTLFDERTNANINGNADGELTGGYAESTIPLTSLIGNAIGRAGGFWNDLNPNLMCSIFEVDHEGKLFNNTAVVRTVFSGDVTLDVNLNWQSPFEGAGAESKAPALMAMLQSGAFQPLIDSIGGKTKDVLQDTVTEARGRTGITKLNSTQVFSGMPPIKIQGNLLFRAWSNPVNEVERMLDTLMQWALPIELAPEGTPLSNAVEFFKGDSDKSLIETIMPSRAPPLVGVTYKGRTYAPMVIESINIPLGSPIDKNGNFTSLLIPVTFSSLTAMDGQEWLRTKSRSF